MALVNYVSSDEDEQAVRIHPKAASLKRKRDGESSEGLPPLPSKFHDLYASTTRVSTRDDPNLHGGRKRATPHIEGNWPTHLYIEWYPSTTEYRSLSTLISTLRDKLTAENAAIIKSFLTSDLGAPLPLHISLSRPIGFATEQKDEFVTSLEGAVKSSGIRPFNVSFSGFNWVPNFEKTRWFLVLQLHEPELNCLNKLLYTSNKVVQDYGQPPLYTQPSTPAESIAGRNSWQIIEAKCGSESKIDWSKIQNVSSAFHISIAWTLESPSQQLVEATGITTQLFEEAKKISFRVEEIKAKVGNVVTNIRLQKNVVEGKSLFAV